MIRGYYITAVVFFCLSTLLPPPVLATSKLAGWGRVNMQGDIIDTACAIDVNSRDQTIDIGVVPLVDIVRDGQGRAKSFFINLVNCQIERSDDKLSDWKQFHVTFDGETEGELFGVRGEASGVALQIADRLGNIALPGEPMPLEHIAAGNMQLSYSLRLMANNRALKAGNYSSSIRFKLDYF
ncbi:pilin (plasmid) [Serratia marcescens]|nr:fimbrial protein [Serratia marcescens]AQT55473.1 pilin [Serratia marcescens]